MSVTDANRPVPTVVLILALVAVFIAGAVGVGIWMANHGSERAELGTEGIGNPVADPPTRAGAIAVTLVPPLEKPPPPKGGFVGSEACADCHSSLVDQYKTHPMWHSLASISTAKPIEDYQQDPVAPSGPRRYRAELRDGKVIHHEVMIDRKGEPIYDQEVEIKYVLGSGIRGRSYMLFEQGKFFQSSLGWYSSKNHWDLSPGYKADRHSRFSRRLGDSCLYCHVGRTALSSADNRYIEPPILEEPIGCERCHGPASEHVAVHESGDWKEGMPDPILNPSRLEPARREDVCNQCHLEGLATILRYGKGHMDFRPGERLEDNWVVFVADGDNVASSGKTRAVSQVQQMRTSGCYQASEGKFGCTSCHNPHFEPTPENRNAFYRERCVACHGQNGAQPSCALAEAERLAKSPDDSCIQCHMPRLDTHDVPHTAQTDHRVLRRADDEVVKVDESGPSEFPIFDGAEDRLPRREVERARGLAMLEQPVVLSDPSLLQGAQLLIAPRLRFANNPYDESFLDQIGDDVPALFGLGRAFQNLGDMARAEACWDTILRIEPNNESALYWKSLNAQNAKEYSRAILFVNQLLRLNPLDATLHGQKAFLLAQLGQWPGACAAAEQSVQLDPSVVNMREFLALAYGNAGQDPLRQQQLAIIARMKEVLEPPADPALK